MNNCPRCDKYIVPEFYCINCGYVPPRMHDPGPNHITELEIPMSLSSPALALNSDTGIWLNANPIR